MNSQRAWDVCSSLPDCCSLLARDISDPALGLSLLVLCSLAGNVTVLELAFPGQYQPGFAAVVARLWSVKAHAVVLSIDSKVNNGMNYTGPDKCGIEGGNARQHSFMKNRSCQTV